MQQVAAGLGVSRSRQVGHLSLCHQMPATLARAGANVNQVVGTANGVFVMLHHHQSVALVAQHLQGVEQHAVVAGVQANGGLVQHVAHALQVAAQLRRQPNALRLTATEGRGTTVEREVTQTYLL